MKTKAAEGRHLLVVLQHMLQSFHHPVNDHDRLRAQRTDALVNLYNELEQWDPDTSIDKIRRIVCERQRDCLLEGHA
eukprot:8963005-Pyramimonas_sp.AAC.1